MKHPALAAAAMVAAFCLVSSHEGLLAQRAPRARDLGVPFDGVPGPLNAITDVAGVEVGHTTLISGEPPLKVGSGPVRTGVTAVLPRGRSPKAAPVLGGWYSQNGNGEMTGTTWVEESGFLEGPIMITNTHSVGVVRDAVVKWRAKSVDPKAPLWWSLPVVAETFDGFLNDINGFHVREEDAFAAIDRAAGGAVVEGNVGGGTGMICYGFKGGIGTASRRLDAERGGYVIGLLVQANFGRRPQLLISGVPVGREIPDDVPYASHRPPDDRELGSIIVVVATDAPLMPHQLKRIARRVSMGLARTGAASGNGSGDIFIAYSTANPGAFADTGASDVRMLANEAMNPLFEATIQATEESIVNALVAAETMVGAEGRVIRLPHDRLQAALRKYNRLR